MHAPKTPTSPHPSAATKPQLVPLVDARSDALQAGHAHAVQRMFDRISPTYDLLNRLLSLGIDRRWRRQALAALRGALPAQGALLDLCAGTLDLALAMEQPGWDGRTVVAADFARDMLVAGRGKVQHAVLAQADAMALPFQTGAFAGAVCGFGIRNVARPVACIEQVHRVLAPGGVFVVLEFFRPTALSTRAFHAFYGQFLLPLLGGIVSGDASAYRYLSQSMRGFLTRQEFEQAMTKAGFRVQGRDLTLGIASLIVGVK